jgi:chemotaxis protein histidine kinase CheA
MAEDKQLEPVEEELAPSAEDERAGEDQYNPAIEPEKAAAWLHMLKESEKAFTDYNAACDNIEKLYANLDMLRSVTRDRQFNLFWANLEILKPSIYAKAPVPVVVPKFKDRRPLYQTTSELLERCSIVAFDLTRINDLLMLVRDDLATNGRGVAWCRYEPADDEDDKTEYVCVDHKGRRDFLHSLSRNWREVTWVAAASYMTQAQAKERFKNYSGDEYQKAEYRVDKELKDLGGADNRERAKFWEIWHKTMDTVVWVAEGCDDVLDKADPDELAQLCNFFPCPKPAYSATQPGSLIPVPDVLQYKDQLDEVNTLTARLHALSDCLEVKGFYPAGSAEISDAVQAAIKTHSPGRVLVPISNWAAFGGSKEVIIWMPIDMIAQTITSVIAVRKQIIDDIYQIMGLSDIMRGSTNPEETLGAQQLKTQYGSVRIRDKQGEMVRLARDIEEITAEIMCSDFEFTTLMQMSQMEIPTLAEQDQKILAIQQQLQMMTMQAQQQMAQQQSAPQAQGMAQASAPNNSQQLQQQFMQMQGNLEDEQAKPTQEAIAQFIKDYRTTAFVLDIETDSTIQANEDAEKQRRAEFMGMMAQLLPQLAALIAQEPGSAEFCGELLKFSVAPFRVGRSLDGSVDNLIQQVEAQASQRVGQPDPKTQADQAKTQAMMQIETQKLQQQKDSDTAANALEMAKVTAKSQSDQMQMANDLKLALFEADSKKQLEMARITQTQIKTQQSQQKHEQKMAEANQKMDLATQAAQQKQVDAENRNAEMAARRQMSQRDQAFKQSQAAMKPFPTVR